MKVEKQTPSQEAEIRRKFPNPEIADKVIWYLNNGYTVGRSYEGYLVAYVQKGGWDDYELYPAADLPAGEIISTEVE